MVLLPVFVVPARRMGNRLAGIQREAADHNAAMGSQMTERFSAPGATLVKLFGRPDQESAEFAARARRVAQIGVRTALVQTTFVTALTLVSALAVALVYGLGGYYALTGGLDAGDVVALSLLLTRLYGPLTALASARVEVMAALVSFERVFEVLDLEPLIQDRPGARDVPAGPVSVELDDVRFSYPSADRVSLASLEDVATLDARGGEEVLHGVTLRAEPGQVIALVGSSGAGKSTIAQLVSRLYDVDAGAVRLAGVDVRDLSAAAIRDAVGMVTQDGHLFHDSIRGNLLFARPDATEEEVWDALERARLADLVRALPDGLATVVGERGYRLSGGERQRLTIARLLLKRPRVVVLDEATAALDSTSEAAVQAALTEVLAGRTALVIAHRLSTIRTADLILVVEDGQIVERGPTPSCWRPAAATRSSTAPSSRRPATEYRPEGCGRALSTCSVDLDEPAAVGGDDQLHPVAYADLGDQAGDVALHGGGGDEEGVADLDGRLALGEEPEHVGLAPGQARGPPEGRQWRRRRFGVRRPDHLEVAVRRLAVLRCASLISAPRSQPSRS